MGSVEVEGSKTSRTCTNERLSAAAYQVSSDAPEYQSILKHLRRMADKNR